MKWIENSSVNHLNARSVKLDIIDVLVFNMLLLQDTNVLYFRVLIIINNYFYVIV